MALENAEQRRLSFGAIADEYDRYRPNYPREAVEWVLPDHLHALKLMDVGAGTGLLTKLLVEIAEEMHPPGTVTAVEPDPQMAEVLMQRLPSVWVIASPAEHIDADEASVDCIVVGQAFHWFEPTVAVPEFARVLRPGGRLGVMWNVRLDSEPWVAALANIVGGEDHTHAREHPRNNSMSGFDAIGAFEPVQRTEFRHAMTLDADQLVGLVDTFSYVRLAPDRDQVLDQVRELTRTHPDLVGKQTFELPYLTVTYRATRPRQPQPGD